VSARDDLALDRSGHLSTWALDRLRLDPQTSEPDFFAAAERHIAACERCRAARAALDAEVAAMPAPLPPASLRAARPPRGGRRLWWIGGAASLAAAALALLIVRPPDDVTPKGSRLDLEVHVADDGRSPRLVADGAVVRPGARAGFRVRAAEDGHLMLFGWDDTGAPYAIHPAGDAARAAPIAAASEPSQVPAAIAFDDVGASERLAAVWCPAPFALHDLSPAPSLDEARLAEAAAARGCVLRVVHLRKARAP